MQYNKTIIQQDHIINICFMEIIGVYTLVNNSNKERNDYDKQNKFRQQPN